MKALTNCADCRKKIFNVYKQEFLREQYKIFGDIADTFGKCCTAAVLMAMVRRGRTKKYIQELYNDLVMIFDTPAVFGKDIKLTDVMHKLEKEYGIDWRRLNVHIETESQFIRGNK